jgi:hypothetical protein
MKQMAKVLRITQRKHHKSHLKLYKHNETRHHPKILMKNFSHKQFNQWYGSQQCAQNTKAQVKNKEVICVVQPLWKPNYTLRWLH